MGARNSLARALVGDDMWHGLSRDERDAVNALAEHLLLRFRQQQHEPLNADGKTFLTVSRVGRYTSRASASSLTRRSSIRRPLPGVTASRSLDSVASSPHGLARRER